MKIEMDKMDIQHMFFTLIRSNRYLASPLDTNQPRVMDLGTGTGIWAIDMAEYAPFLLYVRLSLCTRRPLTDTRLRLYPDGFAVGVDLNLIQPEL